MSSNSQSILKQQLQAFAIERDWQQFHTPKNLAAALSVEASELLEHFQWLTDEQSQSLGAEQLAAVRHEMADVFMYLHLLASKLDVDLYAAAQEKLTINRRRYPVDQCRGRADKASACGRD